MGEGRQCMHRTFVHVTTSIQPLWPNLFLSLVSCRFYHSPKPKPLKLSVSYCSQCIKRLGIVSVLIKVNLANNFMLEKMRTIHLLRISLSGIQRCFKFELFFILFSFNSNPKLLADSFYDGMRLKFYFTHQQIVDYCWKLFVYEYAPLKWVVYYINNNALQHHYPLWDFIIRFNYISSTDK